MKACIVCGEETTKHVACALQHFRLVEWNMWQYWRGNIRTFGLWSGMRGNLTLSFPIINTLWNWKHRKARLVIPK
jgi:hypothetical protein